MSKVKWGYCASDRLSGYSYEMYNTRDAAIAAGRKNFRDEEMFWIGTVRRLRAEDYTERVAETAIEIIEDYAGDYEWSWPEDDLFTYTKSEKVAVDELKRLVQAWAREHLTSRWWTLLNMERIKVSKDTPDERDHGNG